MYLKYVNSLIRITYCRSILAKIQKKGKKKNESYKCVLKLQGTNNKNNHSITNKSLSLGMEAKQFRLFHPESHESVCATTKAFFSQIRQKYHETIHRST